MRTLTIITAFFGPRGIVATAILGLSIVASQAASITWGLPQSITDDSDVSTAGTLVNAVNLGVTTSPTINGVTFTGFFMDGSTPIPGNVITRTSGNFTFASGELRSYNVFGSAAAPFSNLSAPYQQLLASGTGNTGFMTLTMSGLSVGSQYQVQLWSNVSDGDPFSANLGTVATADNSIVLNSSPGGAIGAVGQFGIGTFTADAATELITFRNETLPRIELSAVQLRSIPEPGTTLMLALGASLGCAFGRRREARK